MKVSLQVLRAAAASISDAHEKFRFGAITPMEHRDIREKAMASGLHALATHFGVTLQSPLLVDSRGEFMIVAKPKNGNDPMYGAGPFGEEFAAELNQHSPRMGLSAGALDPMNGWCRMNHFDAERLVLRAAQEHCVEASVERPRG